MLQFLNDNAGAITALFTIVVALSTVIYAYLTHVLVKENRLLRKHQTQPALALYVTPTERWINVLELVIVNNGGGVAHNIHWDIKPQRSELKKYGFAINSLALFDGLTHLAPGQELRTYLGTAIDLLNEPILNELIISATYQDALEQKLRTSVKIRVKQYEGIMRLGESPIEEITKSLKEISSTFTSICQKKINVVHASENKINNERKK